MKINGYDMDKISKELKKIVEDRTLPICTIKVKSHVAALSGELEINGLAVEAISGVLGDEACEKFCQEVRKAGKEMLEIISTAWEELIAKYAKDKDGEKQEEKDKLNIQDLLKVLGKLREEGTLVDLELGDDEK